MQQGMARSSDPETGAASNLDLLARLGLDDFDLRMPGADLILEPLPGILVAVAEQHRSRGDFTDEIEQFIAVGVRGQVEILQLTAPGDLSAGTAENKGLPRLSRF